MRLCLGSITIVLLSACASTESPITHEPVGYEAKVDELLKTRSSDADLLFLRHDRKDLARCSRLADLRPTGLVLASVIDGYLSAGLTSENRAEFDRLHQLWIARDPENAAPILLKGQLAISEGDLEGGLQALLEASGMPFLRTYELEGQRETWRILKKEGLDDIAVYGAVLCRWHYELKKSYQGACGVLTVMAQDHELRGRFDKARACIEAAHSLTLRFLNSNALALDWSLGAERGVWTSARLCEMSLATGDSAAAGRFSNEAIELWRKSHALRIAVRRDLQDNPLVPAYKEAGMWKPKEEGSLGIEWLDGVFDATKEQWQRFWIALREREATIRPYFEAQLERGSATTMIERMTADDHRQLASMEPPMARFWESRADFYPDRPHPGAEDRLFRWLRLTGSDDYEDLPDFMRERAFHALLRRADKETLAKLRGLLEEDAQGNISGKVAVILAAHGDQSDAVKNRIGANLDEADSAVCWAAGRLGLLKAVPVLVKNLVIELWPDRFYTRFDESLACYLALRELAGMDLGFNSAKWEEWARKEGYLKSDD